MLHLPKYALLHRKPCIARAPELVRHIHDMNLRNIPGRWQVSRYEFARWLAGFWAAAFFPKSSENFSDTKLIICTNKSYIKTNLHKQNPKETECVTRKYVLFVTPTHLFEARVIRCNHPCLKHTRIPGYQGWPHRLGSKLPRPRLTKGLKISLLLIGRQSTHSVALKTRQSSAAWHGMIRHRLYTL